VLSCTGCKTSNVADHDSVKLDTDLLRSAIIMGKKAFRQQVDHEDQYEMIILFKAIVQRYVSTQYAAL